MSSELKENIYKLENNSNVIYISNFISKEFSKKLYDELKNNIPWTHGIYKMFEKSIKTPRLLYAM